ncbi:DoxX family protein [Actinopolymorpha singaporensis]|uniref:DoxX family protein n=1 Tax=Actinopolymorpha singaporensis TaxID=117157 RepID=UPI0018D3E648
MRSRHELHPPQIGHRNRGAPGHSGVLAGTARLLLGAGSVGLIAGFGVPALGTAAASGLVLYFLCAAGAHVRGRDTRVASWINWSIFFGLAVAALAVGLAHRGAV